MDKLAALTKGVENALKQRNDALEKVAGLEQRLDSFNKRMLAEEILLEARSTPTVYNTHSIEEFFAKRAELEKKSMKDLEKLAEFMKIVDGKDNQIGIILEDENVHDERPATMDDWVRQYIQDNGLGD